jgi:transglutaminase-like putative cysteine protease
MDHDRQGFSDYLAPSAVIDHEHPAVRRQAAMLARGVNGRDELARRCFLFVRDAIDHSFDINAGAVTCSASEVLQAGHGICYAKSHLLAALLRANAIPAGFGYQRLADDDGGFVLHGYNTLWLPEHGWYRIDARGNTGGIDARFQPPQEQLAFATDGAGEVDYRLNLAAPPACVVRALQQSETVAALHRALPTSVPMG